MAEFFTWLSEFFSTGLYTLITDAFASMIEWLMLLKLKWMLWLLQFSWGIAQTLISNLGVTLALQQAWGSFDSATLANLMFFRIPDAVNIILSALGTKFVLRFLPVGF